METSPPPAFFQPLHHNPLIRASAPLLAMTKGTTCLCRDHVFKLHPKFSLELCCSTCCVLQHQAPPGSPIQAGAPSSAQQRGKRSGFGVNKASWWAQGWLRDQLLFLIHRNCSHEPSQMCPLPWLCDAHIHTCALTQAVQRACFPKTPHSSFISAPISPPPPFQEVSNYCFPAHKHLRLAQQGHAVGGSGKEKSYVCVCVSSPSYTIPAEPVPPVISCWAFSTSVLAHPHVSHCCAIREPCWEGRRFVFGLRKHVGDARAIAGLLLHCKNFLGGRSPDPYNQGCLLGRLQGCLPDTAGVYWPLRQELS